MHKPGGANELGILGGPKCTERHRSVEVLQSIGLGSLGLFKKFTYNSTCNGSSLKGFEAVESPVLIQVSKYSILCQKWNIEDKKEDQLKTYTLYGKK